MTRRSRIPGPRTPAAYARALREFQRSLPHGLTHLARTYGDVCAFGFGPARTVFLFGPTANARILGDPDTFVFTGAYDMLLPIAGDTALVTTDGAAHDRVRRAARPAFGRAAVERATRLIVDEVDTTVRAWTPGRRVDVYQELREAVRAAMIRAFCGPELARRSRELTSHLDRVHELMDYPLPRQLVAWRLPGRARRRALDGVAGVEALVYAEIARRRRDTDAGTPEGDDLIGVMLRARADDGSAMTDQEIRDMVVSALIAGYDPVSSGVGWAVYHLVSDPAVWEAAREETARVLGDAPATPGDARRLHHLNRVVHESMRLHPPVTMSPRRALRSFTHDGHTVPAGSLVAVSQYITHRQPELWPDPDAFRPERWDRDQPGHRAPTPFEYFPYGYGTRRCIGSGLAALVVPTVLSRVVQRASLELLVTDPQPAGIPALFPKDGLPARVGRTPAVRP
ncbi:cytochrome P450 [Streptomyces sp. NPDC052610]|uniref:cytochrome P450 n=1 Tax=Streptomyces sp. NPDC052610 TaxID=3154952 RepID=UPI003433BE7E